MQIFWPAIALAKRPHHLVEYFFVFVGIVERWQCNVDADGDLHIDRDFVVGCTLHARLAIKTLAIGKRNAQQLKDIFVIMAGAAMSMNHANMRPTDQSAS